MEIKHENPALLLEWYKVSVHLTNLEDRPVSDVCLNLSLDRNNSEKVELSSECVRIYGSYQKYLEYYHDFIRKFIDLKFTAEICEDTNKNVLSLPVDFKLGSMFVGDQKNQSFYIRSSSLDTRCFQLMVSPANYFVFFFKTVSLAIVSR